MLTAMTSGNTVSLNTEQMPSILNTDFYKGNGIYLECINRRLKVKLMWTLLHVFIIAIKLDVFEYFI